MAENGSKRPKFFIINDATMLRLVPALAVEIGDNESILLLQLEYLIGISTTVERDGELWTYQSITKLRNDYFPFWSRSTIWRIARSLEKQHLIKIGSFNQSKFDKTLWYCLDLEGCQQLKSIHIEISMFQNEISIRSKRNIDVRKMKRRSSQNETTIPEIPTETPTESSTKTIPVDLWESVLTQLRGQMKRADYETYLASLKPVSYEGGILKITAVNSFTRDWVTSRLGKQITNLLLAETGQPVQLVIELAGS